MRGLPLIQQSLQKVFLLALVLLFVLPFSAGAQLDDKKPFGKGVKEAEKIAKQGNLQDKELDSDRIINLLSIVLVLTGTVALLALVIGGVMYILSFGNEERAKLAKRIIIYAIVGLLVIGAAGLITNLLIALIRF